MTKTINALSGCYMVGRVRKQRCCSGKGMPGETQCENRTRMALVVPCLFEADDGGPGLAAVVLCGVHLEESLIRLADADRKERRQ